MARQRRGGFRPPELRGTLGTLLRTTLQQAGVVRDALERTAREGRSRLDDVRASRRRQDALAELGEIVLELVRSGEIDLAELPEAKAVVRQLDAMDDVEEEHGHSHGGHGHHHHHGEEEDEDGGDGHRHAHAHRHAEREEIARPPSRQRFDDRARGRRAVDEDDGTVSSSGGRAAPPRRAAPASPAPRVWRPPVDVEEDEPPAAAAAPGSARRGGSNLPPQLHRKGGIAFEDDDLAEYMHPDDVPSKPPRDGEA